MKIIIPSPQQMAADVRREKERRLQPQRSSISEFDFPANGQLELRIAAVSEFDVEERVSRELAVWKNRTIEQFDGCGTGEIYTAKPPVR